VPSVASSNASRFCGGSDQDREGADRRLIWAHRRCLAGAPYLPRRLAPKLRPPRSSAADDHLQAKTDALDARLIARLLFDKERLGLKGGFLQRPPRNSDAIRMLVRNRARLVEQRTRCRNQLTAIEDVLFPELKDFFKKGVTSSSARLLLESFPTPNHVATGAAHDDVARRGCRPRRRSRTGARRAGRVPGSPCPVGTMACVPGGRSGRNRMSAAGARCHARDRRMPSCAVQAAERSPR
jgi:hypothetical protein